MNAVERTVVQTTLKEKQALIDKARHLNKSVSEWMRTGARHTRQPMGVLVALAIAAQAFVQRSMAAIDDALASSIDVARRCDDTCSQRVRPTLREHFGT